MPAPATYFIVWKGRRDGPYTLPQLADLLQRGEIGLLDRIETSTGQIGLRQLLMEADPARWSSLAATPGTPFAAEYHAPSAVPPGAGTQSSPAAAMPNPLGTPAPLAPPAPPPLPAAFPAAPAPESPSPAAPPAAGASIPADLLRDYLLCGLSFLVPPLAGWIWQICDQRAARGETELARKMRYTSLGLAAGGLVFWLLVWWAW
jgi:hypothetical protein